MLHVKLNAQEWSKEQFGLCELGDKRRTNRLIQMGELLASQVGNSLLSSCEGVSANVEGSYRFIRNNDIKATSIAEGGYQASVERSRECEQLLALEDTTSMSFHHAVKKELGDLGGPKKSIKQGWQVHSVLLVDAKQEQTIGLIEQTRWKRAPEQRGIKKQRGHRAYKTKESYKWESASNNVEKRMCEQMKKIISVCDREADIYDYLSYKIENKQRFIVRASQNRRLLESKLGYLFDEVASSSPLGKYTVSILQKSGRAGRKAEMELRQGQVIIQPPKGSMCKIASKITVVMAKEIKASKEVEALEWILLTTEVVENFTMAREIIRFYEMRWKIEEFHKAWKTGAGAERQRMQKADNLERMLVILSFIGVRLLQLKEAIVTKAEEDIPCTQVLTRNEWVMLWFFIHKKGAKSIPKKSPNLAWAYQAIAKLGGWNNSKNIGSASWLTIWKGWFRLQECIEGLLVAKRMVEI